MKLHRGFEAPLSPFRHGRFSETLLAGLIIQVVNVGSGIILARALGPSGRGEVALAMLWPTLFAALGSLGIADAVTFHSSRDQRRGPTVLGAAMSLGVLQSLVLLPVGLLLVPVLLSGSAPAVQELGRFYLLIIPLNYATLYSGAVLQAAPSLRDFNVGRATVHIGYTVFLAMALVLGQMSPQVALTCSLGANLVTLLAMALLLRRRSLLPKRSDIGTLRTLMGFGVRAHLGQIATLLGARIDVGVLSFICSSDAIGRYVVAATVAGVMQLVPSSAAMVLYPDAARRGGSWPTIAASSLMVKPALIATAMAAVLAWVIMPWAFPLLFGESFREAVMIANWLVLAQLTRGWCAIILALVRGSGMPGRASVADAVWLATLAAALAVAVPLWKELGAAIASALSAAVALAFVTWQLRAARAGLTGRGTSPLRSPHSPYGNGS